MRIPARPTAKEWRERAHIRVGTLNMNGRGAQQISYTGSKWPEINAIMRDRRVSVLAVQETHLSPDHLVDIDKLYSRLLVINSAHENATSTAGVAIVLNRDHIADPENTKSWEIVPGRALAAQLTWKSQSITILAVYAPNDKEQSISLWEQISKWKDDHADECDRIDILLGDMNFVEDEMDRAPVRFANVDEARTSFRALKEKLSLSDGWRRWNEGRLEWTWRRPGTFERSRIDRVYLNDKWLEDSRDWTIDQALSSSDHYMVTVDLTNKLCPRVGRGRWAMPNAILSDKKFEESLQPLVFQLARDIDECRRCRSNGNNVQTVFDKFKSDAATLARERSKAMGSTAKRTINELNRTRIATQNDNSLDEAERSSRVQDLEASIAEQQTKQARKRSDQVKTTDWVMGDDQNKYFYSQGKQHKPRDTVKSLKLPGSGPPRWATESSEMTKVAKDFYENLQTVDMDKDPEERAEAIDEALNHVNRHLSTEQKSDLGAKMSRDLVALALKESKKDSAPGTNGLPYEFWQMLDRKFNKTKDSDQAWPDIIQILTWVYNDVEEHGVDPATSFTRGWLCPLFKKGNRDDIANYRPITLLNADYKLFTKALSIRLASVAPELIHKDQAGFMKGRSITDQTKLAKLMVNWGEARSVNGAIVCLDQEKAYDRIAHDYLFVTLGAYNIPESFINTVKALYEHAETEVILNGFCSETFRVIRGVRQGDPLSCLLFNLAIEPLAEMIRCSRLKGFELPGSAYRLVVSLFADGTCVYLSQGDDPAILQAILDLWCVASGAKFNLRKTEIVPIGSESFRNELAATRHMRPDATRHMRPDTAPFHPGAKIAAQGEAVRLLGAYIGNGIDNNGPWEPIIESIKKTLRCWSFRTLTLTGRTLIARSIVSGKTQYLGMVQGMPRNVQEEVTEAVMNFIWPEGRKKAYINADILRARTEEGGKLLPDFFLAEKSRELTWLRKMCLPADLRPIWVDVAEDFMKIRIKPDGGDIPEAARVSPLLQQWRPNFNGLPHDLRRMIEVAKEVGFQINAAVIPMSIKRRMPFWLHLGRRPADTDLGNRTSQCDSSAKCLQITHKIMTTGQAADALRHWDLANHLPEHRDLCECDECIYASELGCPSPEDCYDKILAVMNEIAPRWDPRTEQENDSLALSPDEIARNTEAWSRRKDDNHVGIQTITFDPLADAPGDFSEFARVFCNSLRSSASESTSDDLRRPPAVRRAPQLPALQQISLTIATKVLCPNGDDAICGACALFSVRDWEPTLIKLRDDWASSECGTLEVLTLALESLERTVEITIRANNKLVVQRLTKDFAKNSNLGWSQIPRYASQYRALAELLVSWNARIRFEENNTTADDEEARLGAERALGVRSFTVPKLSFDRTHANPGMKLTSLSQNIAFKALKARKSLHERQGTMINVGRTRSAVAEVNGHWPTKQKVWQSLRSRDFYRPTREFLWRMMHNTQKVGNFWFRIQNREMLSECPPCEVTETMDHILLECQAPGPEAIWREARELWARTGLQWPDMSLGLIMGCALVEFKSEKGRQIRGAARLFRILASESAFLIWKLRNERRIQNSDDSEKFPFEQEIVACWRASIEKRLRIDAHWTSQRRYKRRALDWRLMRETWERVLHRPNGLSTPNNWWAGPELLVSIWPHRPRGRER